MNEESDFRRNNQRKRYTAPVVFSHRDRAFNGHIQNVSLGGAFIMCDTVNQFSIGDRITVSIPFTAGTNHVKRRAQVKWINNEGVGIEFL